MSIGSVTSSPAVSQLIAAVSTGSKPQVNDHDADDLPGASAQSAPPAGMGAVVDKTA